MAAAAKNIRWVLEAKISVIDPLTSRDDGDAIVAVVDYRILEKCVEATVDIDPVRVSCQIRRDKIQTGHPCLYVFIESQEARRLIFHGQRPIDSKTVNVCQVIQDWPPAIFKLQPCTQPPTVWIPSGSTINRAFASDGDIREAHLVSIRG